ncbi:caspase family protein, partial [Candidatus Poribacteria bacterium]
RVVQVNRQGVSGCSRQNYLLAYESDIRPFLLPKTALSVEELNQYLSKIQSGNTILILDACRNNPSAGRGDEDNLMTNSFVESVEDIKFRATIYSCNTGQRAYEWPGRGRGFFSVTLEEALSGKADEDTDGNVTLNEVGLYLANRVPDLVKRELGRGKTQIPRVDISGDPRASSMVLSWTAAEQKETKSASPSPDEMALSRELKTGTPQYETDLTDEPEEELTPQLSEVDLTEDRIQDEFSELDIELPEPGLKPLTQQEKAEGWVDVTGECYGESITPEEAQQSALERARRSAIEIALGAERPTRGVLIRSVEDFHRAFVVLSQSDRYGKIVEEKEPVWTSDENIQIRPGDSPVPLYCAALRARVSQEESQPDPGFTVSLRLNNGAFLDGEEMILSITPTQDCYITVFNILSDHTVLVLDTSQGRVPGRQTSRLPDEAERQSGKQFRVALPKGRREDIESVIVIATKDNISFFPGQVKDSHPDIAVTGEKSVLGILPTYQTALEEINGWLVGIPLERRTFDLQQYRIRRGT